MLLRDRAGLTALSRLSTVAVAALSVAMSAHAGRSTSAAVVADLLAQGEVQATAPGRARALQATLQSLDRLGVRAVDPAGDPRSAWRRIARYNGEPDYRGRVLGPAFARGRIGPGQSIRLEQQFLGGQPSDVAISAVPSGPLEVAVTDMRENAVCRGVTSCSWTPAFTDRYAVTVRNTGRVAKTYYLVTN